MNTKVLTTLHKAVEYAMKRRENLVGYKVEFKNIPDGWLKETVNVDMTFTWWKYGLRGVQGLNYFTIGSIIDGLSTRFDPKSKYYQAWVGCYLVKLDKPSEWNMNEVYKLALADQDNWLGMYGVQNPNAYVDEKNIRDEESITISGYKAHVQSGNIWSHSDVSTRQPTIINMLKLNAYAQLVRSANNDFDIEAQSLIPPFVEEKVKIETDHEKLLLSGIIAYVEITDNVKALFYANGYIDQKANTNTFDQMRDEIYDMFKNARIVKL